MGYNDDPITSKMEFRGARWVMGTPGLKKGRGGQEEVEGGGGSRWHRERGGSNGL